MSVIRKELGAFAALAALPAVMPAVAPAAAASAPVANECVTRLLSADEMRPGVPSEVTCYRTHAKCSRRPDFAMACGRRWGCHSLTHYSTPWSGLHL